MKTNDLYKIFIEEVLCDPKVKFDIFPSNVNEVSVIPRPMGLYNTITTDVYTSSNMDRIELYKYQVNMEVAKLIEDSYKDAFVRLTLRNEFHNRIVKPAYTMLTLLQYNIIKGFISGKIEVTDTDKDFELVEITGKIAIYGQ